MKINRFTALAAIALLAVGAMAAISSKVWAQGSHNPVVSISAQSDLCAQDQADGTEIPSATDTDNIDLQCGDQNTPDSGQEAVEAKSADGQDAAPTGTPAITAEAAQKAAESYLNAGTAVKVQLDDENGKLVYSVEFSNSTDVKVDAMTGSVLGADTGQD